MCPATLPNASRIVRRSASAWHGWCSSVSMLKTGTSEAAASSSIAAWDVIRTPNAATWRENTRAVSTSDSPRESCISVSRSTSGWPPSSNTPASNDSRVRVDGAWNSSATDRPSSAREDSGAAFSAAARSRISSRSAGRELAAGEEVAGQAGNVPPRCAC